MTKVVIGVKIPFNTWGKDGVNARLNDVNSVDGGSRRDGGFFGKFGRGIILWEFFNN